MDTTFCLLTSNNCIQQLEALPREIFVPFHSIISYTNKSTLLLSKQHAPSPPIAPPSPTTVGNAGNPGALSTDLSAVPTGNVSIVSTVHH